MARFGLAADMWALGTMLYKLAARRMPYFTPEEMRAFKTQHDILSKVVSRDVDFASPPWDAYSDDAKDFVRRLLLREEEKRMTAEEATDHPFLKRWVNVDSVRTAKAETAKRWHGSRELQRALRRRR